MKGIRVYILQVYNYQYGCWDDHKSYGDLEVLQYQLKELIKGYRDCRIIEVLPL